MKAVLVVACALTALALSGCTDGSGDVVADDPTGADTTAAAEVPEQPVPTGDVATRGLVTVIADAKRPTPEMCLGPIAESYPPMCGGLPMAQWDWDETGSGIHETQGETRWGSYAVTGTWDGTTFTTTSAIPAALYDPAVPAETPTPTPATSYDAGELEVIATEVGSALPDALGVAPVEGHVLVDVVYDDGTLQEWADTTYGADVVLVTSALLDVTS